MRNKDLQKWLIIIIILFIVFVIPNFFKVNEGYAVKSSDPIVNLNTNLKTIFANVVLNNQILKNNTDTLNSMQQSLQSNNTTNQTNTKFVRNKLDKIYLRMKHSNIANRVNTASINDMRREQNENKDKIHTHLKRIGKRIWHVPTKFKEINTKLDEYKNNSQKLTSEILQKTEGNNIATSEFQTKIFKRLKIAP